MLDFVLNLLTPALPMTLAIVATALALAAVNFVFDRRFSTLTHRRVIKELSLLVVTMVGLLIVILVSPLSEARTGQLLSLVGILGSASIALSSTTFLGNALAGFMLRAVGSFKLGDFVQVGDFFGRVSAQGLFHTEIQTETRDLTTVPNLYLVTNPVQVIRSSGTIVRATVSLGYDVHHSRIEELLVQGALEAQLEEPYVHVTELGDFSVTYQVAGLLTNTKEILSARSRLRKRMMDALHGGGVEIVSPTFMNQRPQPADKTVIPQTIATQPEDDTSQDTVEAVAFDKADRAESIEHLRERDQALAQETEAIREAMKESSDEAKAEMEKNLEQLKARREHLAAQIQQRTEELADD